MIQFCWFYFHEFAADKLAFAGLYFNKYLRYDLSQVFINIELIWHV